MTENGVTEYLDLTIRLHDASDVKITNAKILGVNDKAILNLTLNKQDSTATAGKVTFDTYKYGMDNNVSGTLSYTATQKTGRLYTVELTTNIPVDSIVKTDKNTASSLADWKDVITKTGTNTFTYTIDADDSTNLANYKFLLGNRWGLYDTTGPVASDQDKSNQSILQIVPNDKSRLQIWTTNSKNKMIYSNMLNLASDLNLDGRQVENLKEQIEGHAVESTLQDNLTASKEHIKSVYNADKNLNTLTYNLSYFKDIKVDNAKGKWAVVYFCCRDSEDITGNDIPGALYVDKLNASRLLTASTYQGGMTNDETWDLVPIWINLSAPELAKYVKDVDENSAEALEIKLSTTNPEEHNSIFVTFENTSAAQEIEHVEKATGSFNSQEYKDADTNTKQELAKKLMSNPGADAEDYANTLINAMEILEKGSISEPRVVDDTVYLTVKADLSEFATNAKGKDNHVRIPLKLDVSMLGAKDGTTLNIWSRQGESWSSTYEDNRDFDGNYLDFVINFTNSSKYQESGTGSTTDEVDNFTKSKSVTKTFIITTLSNAQSIDCSAQPNNCDKEAEIIKGLREKNANYVKYVIDFVEG